jgi:hypothetical protein
MVSVSPRPVYTLSFRLPRQTLWDIPPPLLPLPRCSLFACHLSAARSSCAAQPRGIDPPRGDGSKGLARASAPGFEAMSFPCNFLFCPISDSSSPSSCGTSNVSLSGSPRLPRKSSFRWRWDQSISTKLYPS